MTPGKDRGKQHDLLHNRLRRDDATEGISACDVGCVGELIFRAVCYMADCTEVMQRLWIPSMENIAIRAGFSNLRHARNDGGLHQTRTQGFRVSAAAIKSKPYSART